MEDMALSDCEDSASGGGGRCPHGFACGCHRPDGLGLRVGSKAGPCGDGIPRAIAATGPHGRVVAPGLVPRCATDRVTTDRRAATLRTRDHRSGSLTPTRVPDLDPNAPPVGSLAPQVEARIRLRGITAWGAVVILAELGTNIRCDSPQPWMRVRDRVPSERSSGPRRRTGGITTAGPGPVRRFG